MIGVLGSQYQDRRRRRRPVWARCKLMQAMLTTLALYSGLALFVSFRILPETYSLQRQRGGLAFNGYQQNAKCICFVTAAYAANATLVDMVSSTPFANLPGVKHYLFTNLKGFQVEGWESIVVDFLSQYKRSITQSRYGKFLGWRTKPIRETCHTVFYLDGNIQINAPISAFEDLASRIHQPNGPGWMQTVQDNRDGGVVDELHEILRALKDSPQHVQETLRWLQGQQDFDPVNTRIYHNAFFGYAVPPSPSYEHLSTEFWKVYSKENQSWRDQPLWAFFTHRFGVDPLAFPRDISFYFDEVFSHQGFGRHRYFYGSINPAYKVAFLSETPSTDFFHRRGHQIVNQINAGVGMASNSSTFLLTVHQCGFLGSFCPDICIFVGPCADVKSHYGCCRLKILDSTEIYLHQKDRIDNSLLSYDGVIVSSERMGTYFRKDMMFSGDIQVLWHHSDPIWYKTKTRPGKRASALRFGLFGKTLTSLEKTAHVPNVQELKRRYRVSPLDIDNGTAPSFVDFECDLRLGTVDSMASIFETTAEVATSAALGHTILTTKDEAVLEVLPADYPFFLSNSSIEAVDAAMQRIALDYARNQLLWQKGLQIMAQVNQTLHVSTVSVEYRNYMERLVHGF